MTRFRLGFVLLSVLLVAVLVGCRRPAGGKASLPQEDLRAKQMLQGIWLSRDMRSTILWAGFIITAES